MTTLKTTKRNPEVKAKKLRRDGFAMVSSLRKWTKTFRFSLVR